MKNKIFPWIFVISNTAAVNAPRALSAGRKRCRLALISIKIMKNRKKRSKNNRNSSVNESFRSQAGTIDR